MVKTLEQVDDAPRQHQRSVAEAIEQKPPPPMPADQCTHDGGYSRIHVTF